MGRLCASYSAYVIQSAKFRSMAAELQPMPASFFTFLAHTFGTRLPKILMRLPCHYMNLKFVLEDGSPSAWFSRLTEDTTGYNLQRTPTGNTANRRLKGNKVVSP